STPTLIVTRLPYTTLFRSEYVASGVVSVAPYAWKNGILCFSSNARIIPIGAAEPPHKIPRKLLRSYVLLSNSFRRPSQIVGTPRSEEHTSELQSRFDLVCRL